MSWRQTENRPWHNRNYRGRGGRGNNHNKWEDRQSTRSRPWRSQSRRHSPLRTKIYQPHRDESSDEEVRAEKLKTASLVKSRLKSLTVEDKSESMKQLLVINTNDVVKEALTDTKDTAANIDKESRRIAHVPKPIKPVPPPPNLPPLLAEQLEISNDIEAPSHIMPQRIDRKLLQDLISMPINDLKKMVQRPSSKDNQLFKHLMKNTRVSLSDAMRRLAEHKLQNFGLENPFTELENLVDSDLAVDVCSKPIETIQALMDIFNLNLDGEYDNMGLQVASVSPLPKPEYIESKSVECIVKNESHKTPFQWHVPCSIETNKSFLNSFNGDIGTESSKSCVTFSPAIKIENPLNSSESADSPTFDPFVNAFTLPPLPQPVPPPEPLDIIMKKSKRNIDINRLSDQLKDSINMLQKIATEEHKKSKLNFNDATNSEAFNIPLQPEVPPHQLIENVSSINTVDIRSIEKKKLPIDASSQTLPLKSTAQLMSKVDSISVCTQTNSVRLKDSSTQRHAHKLFSRSCQASPVSLTKHVQTITNVVHNSIQTNNVEFKSSSVQTEFNYFMEQSITQSKNLVDKCTQHIVALSHRGEQTNPTFFTSNKSTQTKLQESLSKNKAEVLTKKDDSKPSSSPTSKVCAIDARSSFSLPTENSSLLSEFSVLRNDIKSLATGSQLRKRLISSMLDVMSSTFINFYNLFNEVAEKSKDHSKDNPKTVKHRIECRSPSSSQEIKRKKMNLENHKDGKSSLNLNHKGKNKLAENPKRVVKHAINIEKNRKDVKVGFKRGMDEETVIITKKVKRIEETKVIPKKFKSDADETKNNSSMAAKSMQQENIISRACLEESKKVIEDKLVAKTVNNLENNNEDIDLKENKIDEKNVSNIEEKGREKVEDHRNKNEDKDLRNNRNSISKEIEEKECKNHNVAEVAIAPPCERFKEIFNLKECYVKCLKLNPSSSSRIKPKISDLSTELEEDLQEDSAVSVFCQSPCLLLSSNEIPFDNIKKESYLDENSVSLETENSCSKLEDNSEKGVNSDPLSISTETHFILDPVIKNELRNEDTDAIILNSELLDGKSITTTSDLSFQDSDDLRRKLTFGHIEFIGHNQPVTSFKVSGYHVLAASGNDIICFSFKSGKRKRMYCGNKSCVTCLCLLPKKGGEVVFSGSYDQVIRAFSVQNSSLLCTSPDLGSIPNFLLNQGNSVLNGDLYAFLNNGVLISLNPKTLKIKNKFVIGDFPLLCAAAAEINNKKTIFISTENHQVVYKEIDSDTKTQKLNWESAERAERLVYHDKSLYCGSKLPNIIVFNFASDVVSKHVINCLEDPVSLCILEHSLLVGSQLGRFQIIGLNSETVQAEFSKEGNFTSLYVHKKMVIGTTIEGKLIAWPLPQKVRKILQV